MNMWWEYETYSEMLNSSGTENKVLLKDRHTETEILTSMAGPFVDMHKAK
jgi:hypothetical protein